MKPLCAHCKTSPVKHPKRKYCSRACYRAAITVIDVGLAVDLRQQGLIAIEMERFIPATAGAIRKAMSRHRSAA